ncbi:hypothetical protein Q5H92_17790 [Hymenobacter sp. M29]|uniref:Uncharacterized protein n=1 Tax=Hymenobacter mellowenesis TaxID=3063995 RepID=A0ABT9AFX6_9BACT|nr:hypothetical protein [Hymenobacter sp. M29]MDO7848224.1 hypothetical protein [Hymenobacter sp. M29]
MADFGSSGRGGRPELRPPAAVASSTPPTVDNPPAPGNSWSSSTMPA